MSDHENENLRNFDLFYAHVNQSRRATLLFSGRDKWFSGQTLVSWLLSKAEVETEKEALDIGLYYLNNGLITSINGPSHGILNDSEPRYKFCKNKRRIHHGEPNVKQNIWVEDSSCQIQKTTEIKQVLGSLDEYNLKLLQNVHPHPWIDPNPDSAIYNLVVRDFFHVRATLFI
jgi:hypothetical protein